MTAKAKKGASPLHLNNKELRRELYRADVIILTALSMLDIEQHTMLERKLIDCHVTDDQDPLADSARLQAMHRITPKCDYVKLILWIAALILSAQAIFNYFG